MVTANIDGDILLYAVGFASETTVYVCTDGTEFDTAKEATPYCKQHNFDKIKRRDPAPDHVWKGNVNTMIRSIKKNAKADEVRIFFSAPHNFRMDIYPEYKANRKGMAKPYCYHDLKEYIEKGYPCEEQDGYEADDLLAICQTEDTILCSLDKDLDQITGWHYNWRKDALYIIDEPTGHYNLYVQVLMGDATDNIKGLPGIGVKKAERVLDRVNPDAYEEVCKLTYKSAGLFPEDYQLTYDLVYIKREFDDDS